MGRRRETGARTGGGGGDRATNFDERDAERTGNGGPWGFDPELVRQMRREGRVRLGEARALAELIQRAGADPRELQAMINAMRALDRASTYDDPEEAIRLQAELVEGMKQLEFQLRRLFGAEDEDQLLLYQSGDVPEEYRAMVEQYYRELAKSRGSGR